MSIVSKQANKWVWVDEQVYEQVSEQESKEWASGNQYVIITENEHASMCEQKSEQASI